MTRAIDHVVYEDGRLRISRGNEPTVLRFTGEIDYDSCPAVLAAVTDASDGTGVLYIDLTAVSYCDVAGLRTLITPAADNGRRDHRDRLILHAVPRQLRTLLRVVGWDRLPQLVVDNAPSPADD